MCTVQITMSNTTEDLAYESFDLDQAVVKYPEVIPAPRLSAEAVTVSDGASDASELQLIRAGLREQVDTFSMNYAIELPKDDIVEVGSELAANALRADSTPSRSLEALTVGYVRFGELPPEDAVPGAVGRFAVMARDNDPEFRTDANRSGFHRGLLVAAALSSVFGYFSSGNGKTIVAEFDAMPVAS
jgi:hypothetical protein